MDFSLSDEQRLLGESAERFVRECYDLEARRRLVASAEGFSQANWQAFADRGWLALTVPEDVGGIGASAADLAVLMLALGAGCILEPFVTSAVLGARIIDASPLRVELLPAIADGSMRVALAHDETGERYDPRGPRRVSARPVDGQFRLTGTKRVVLAAPSAQRLLVTATIAGDTEYSVLIVDADAAGVTLSPYALVDGTRAADIVFADAPARLLVAASTATEVVEEAIDRASVAWLAEAVGSMEASLDLCSAYLKTRHQFGQPIGKFQALQHIIAEMFVEAQAARSILYQALANIDADPPVRRHAVSAARIVSGEAARIVSRSGIQLHGGYGITDEYAISHHYRRQFVLGAIFGDGDYHLDRFIAAGSTR